jgi:hypothetical protein
MRVDESPDRAELAEFLQSCLGERGPVTIVENRPLADRSTHALNDLELRLAGGVVRRAVLKDFAAPGFVTLTGLERPRFVADRQREIAVYREILEPHALGAPALLGFRVEPARERFWLLLEKVDGAPLWQHGELELWQRTAAWLAGLHGRSADENWLRAARGPARLLRHDGDLFRAWLGRARQFQARRAERALGAEGFLRLARAAEEAIAWLERQPPSFLHGELYPSNVLVERDAPAPAPGASPAPAASAVGAATRIRPIDWEMAGVGAAALDVAALTSGAWSPEERETIAEAYRSSMPAAFGRRLGSTGEWADAVERCRLLVAVQWLGWKRRAAPPPHQIHDWLADAHELAMRPGLSAAGG